MSSSGIRRRRNTDDRTDDAIKQVEDAYIRKAKTFTDRGRQETGNVGPAAIGGASIPGASFLPISGKYGMIGSVAFNPIAKFATDERINVTPDQDGSSKDSSYILVAGQGSPSDLRFIDGATKNGQIFWFQGTATQIINIKHATITTISSISGETTVTVVTDTNHNMVTNDKTNIILTENFNVQDTTITRIDDTSFTYSATGSATSESTGVVQNGNVVTPDGEDIVLDGTIALNGVPMVPLIFDPTVLGFGAWRPAQLTTGSGGGDGSQTPWIQNIDGAGFTLSDAGDISIKNVKTDGLEAVLTLERNDNTPTDGDEAGTIFFVGPVAASSGGAITGTANYAAIEVTQIAVTTGAKNAQLTISAQNGNVFAPILDYTGDDSILKVSSGVDVFRGNSVGGQELGSSGFPWDDVFSETFTLRGSGGNATGTARTIYADSAGMIFNMPTADPTFTHSVNNVILSLLTNGELNIRTVLEDGPTLRLQNDDQTPNVSDGIGRILFTGETSPLSTESTYGSMVVTALDVSSTLKQSRLRIQAQHDNSLLNIFDYTGDDTTLRISSAVDVMRPNANGSKELGNSSFFWDDVFTETLTIRGSGGDLTGSKITIYGDATSRLNLNNGGNGTKFLTNNVLNMLITTSSFRYTATAGGNALAAYQLDTTGASGAFFTQSFQHQNGVGNLVSYTGIQHFAEEITSDSLNGEIQFSVASDSLNSTASNSLPVILDLKSASGVFQMGFFGVTPVEQPDNWIISNFSVDRTFNASSVTLAVLGQVVASIVNDLNDLGLFDATIT